MEVPRRLCVHNVCQHAESRRRQVRLSRQASASSLTLSHAASSMPGQCGSSSAKRCEHVEVTFSGWTCILRQGLEPALTRQSWLRALCFTALHAYFRSRPRTLAIKTRPRGPYRGWGGYDGVDGRPSVFRRGEGVKVAFLVFRLLLIVISSALLPWGESYRYTCGSHELKYVCLSLARHWCSRLCHLGANL